MREDSLQSEQIVSDSSVTVSVQEDVGCVYTSVSIHLVMITSTLCLVQNYDVDLAISRLPFGALSNPSRRLCFLST